MRLSAAWLMPVIFRKIVVSCLSSVSMADNPDDLVFLLLNHLDKVNHNTIRIEITC